LQGKEGRSDGAAGSPLEPPPAMGPLQIQEPFQHCVPVPDGCIHTFNLCSPSPSEYQNQLYRAERKWTVGILYP